MANIFLRSPRVAAILLGHSTIRRRDTVYDLGAGSGVITSALARRCQQVVAVENEPRALDALRRHTAAVPHVRIIAVDIRQLTLPAEPYKVFANIPFALSADIVRMLTTASTPPQAIYLIVQRQFASKLVPSDRHFTAALGAQLAPWWQARIRYRLRRTDFTPPPAVDTVLLELLPRTEPWLPATSRRRTASLWRSTTPSHDASLPCRAPSLASTPSASHQNSSLGNGCGCIKHPEEFRLLLGELLIIREC